MITKKRFLLTLLAVFIVLIGYFHWTLITINPVTQSRDRISCEVNFGVWPEKAAAIQRYIRDVDQDWNKVHAYLISSGYYLRNFWQEPDYLTVIYKYNRRISDCFQDFKPFDELSLINLSIKNSTANTPQ